MVTLMVTFVTVGTSFSGETLDEICDFVSWDNNVTSNMQYIDANKHKLHISNVVQTLIEDLCLSKEYTELFIFSYSPYTFDAIREVVSSKRCKILGCTLRCRGLYYHDKNYVTSIPVTEDGEIMDPEEWPMNY